MLGYSGQALISFTYDDGRKNNFDLALPLHEKYKIPPCFAIIAGRTVSPDRWDRNMTPWQVVDSKNRGAEICSHSYSHLEKLTALSDKNLNFELKQSKLLLNGFFDESEHPVQSLCVPFSSFDDRVLQEAGKYYSTIRVSGKKLNDIQSPKDAKLVHSVVLDYDSDIDFARRWIDKAISEKKWLVFMLHGILHEISKEYHLDINVGLLENILKYVSDQKSDVILPTTLSQAQEIRSNI